MIPEVIKTAKSSKNDESRRNYKTIDSIKCEIIVE